MEAKEPAPRCPAAAVLQKVFGGKWKIEILYYIIFEDVRRFGELRRRIGNIAESTLARQLKELEALGILERHDYQEKPLRVEYELTELGRSCLPAMAYMKAWGEEHADDFS